MSLSRISSRPRSGWRAILALTHHGIERMTRNSTLIISNPTKEERWLKQTTHALCSAVQLDSITWITLLIRSETGGNHVKSITNSCAVRARRARLRERRCRRWHQSARLRRGRRFMYRDCRSYRLQGRVYRARRALPSLLFEYPGIGQSHDLYAAAARGSPDASQPARHRRHL